MREPSDHNGNEPTPDIPIEGPGEDIKNKMTKTLICNKHVDCEHTFIT